jgi:hypothetical protein
MATSSRRRNVRAMCATAAMILLVAAVVFVASRPQGGPQPAEVRSAPELLDTFELATTEAQMRSLLGDPTHVEARGAGALWTYDRPRDGLTHMQLRFGERRRLLAVGFTFSDGAPSLGAELDRDFGSRCKGWATNDQTVWCFEPSPRS